MRFHKVFRGTNERWCDQTKYGEPNNEELVSKVNDEETITKYNFIYDTIDTNRENSDLESFGVKKKYHRDS